MQVNIESGWHTVLSSEFEKPYFHDLVAFVKNAYASGTVYPPGKLIFHAFDQTPFEQVKVVILGQDPYHGAQQAHGLSFSVPEGVPLPPSLKNIYKELEDDLGIKKSPNDGNLISWTQQGVLLLNATLTVAAGMPGSHQNRGWEKFTDAVIEAINHQKSQVVFVLWGAYAQKKGQMIDSKKHLIIESAHPSPFSVYRGFYGSKPFSRCNTYLKSHGIEAIEW